MALSFPTDKRMLTPWDFENIPWTFFPLPLGKPARASLPAVEGWTCGEKTLEECSPHSWLALYLLPESGLKIWSVGFFWSYQAHPIPSFFEWSAWYNEASEEKCILVGSLCLIFRNQRNDQLKIWLRLRGYCTFYQKLVCFVLYIKIINTFLKNNICIFIINC